MDIARAPYDILLKYDRHAFLYQNADKRLSKKSYDARLNCKHIHVRRSPRSPTMSKKSKGKSQTEMIGANVT